jgi:hypothetical protein
MQELQALMNKPFGLPTRRQQQQNTTQDKIPEESHLPQPDGLPVCRAEPLPLTSACRIASTHTHTIGCQRYAQPLSPSAHKIYASVHSIRAEKNGSTPLHF